MTQQGLASAAQQLQSYGRGPDTMLAHISPDEAQFIDYLQGGRRTNPQTGLPEYSLFGDILKSVARAAGSIVGYSIAGPAGAALGAGLTTKATGGSWSDALKSGALGGLGAEAGQGLSGNGWNPISPGSNPYEATGGDIATGQMPQISQVSGIGAITDPSTLFGIAKSPAGIGAGLGAMLNADSTPTTAAPTLPPQTPININALPLQRGYTPYQGDYAHYGETAGPHQFFQNVNPQPIYGPIQTQAAEENTFKARGGRVRRMADGGDTSSSGDNEGDNQGANPIVVPGNFDWGTVNDLRDFENEMQNYNPNLQSPDYSSPTAGNTGFLDRVGNWLSNAYDTVKNDVSNPGKGLQDIVSGTTGVQFAPGSYTATQDPNDYGKLNVNFQSDASWNPTGINPLTALGYAPGIGQIATLGNLGASIAGYDPTINFGNGSETKTPSTPPNNDTIVVAANTPNMQQYGPPPPQVPMPGGNGTDPALLAGNYNVGVGGGGGAPSSVPVAGTAPTVSVPVAQGSPPTVAATPTTQTPGAINVAASTPQPRTYQAYQGDYAHYGEPGSGNGWQWFTPNPGTVAQKAAGGRVRRMALGGALMTPQGPQIRQPGSPAAFNVPMSHALMGPQGPQVPGGGIGNPTQMQAMIRHAALTGYAMGRARGGAVRGPAVSAPSPAAEAGAIHGPGGGKADLIPAKLAAGEHVFDSMTVSQLGDGDNDAGHRLLEHFKQKIRSAAGQKNPSRPTPKRKAITIPAAGNV